MVKDVGELVAALKAKGLAVSRPHGRIRMSKILIVAEHLNGKLNPATAKCVSCAARSPAPRSTSLVLAADPAAIAAAGRQIAGVAKVLTVANAANAHRSPQVLAPQVAEAGRRLQPRVRPVDHLRQGPDALRRRPARRQRRSAT
jgi:electron transfer flavoprotein alpha subunit